MSPLGSARFGFAGGGAVSLEMTFYIVAGGGGAGKSRFHSGWGNFAGAGGGAGGYIEGTAEIFERNVAYTITIGAGGGGQSNGNDTTMTYNGGTIVADGGGRGGNGSGNYDGAGGGSNGGSGGGGGTVFANVVPQDGGGYNGGQDTQPGLSAADGAGLTGFGNDGGRGYRGASGASTGRTGGAGSGGVYNVNSTGNGAGKTVTPLGYTVAAGGGGNTANRGHGGPAGNNAAGGSGFIYILHDSGLSIATTGLTRTTGTYGDFSYVHITAGTAGTITFS